MQETTQASLQAASSEVVAPLPLLVALVVCLVRTTPTRLQLPPPQLLQRQVCSVMLLLALLPLPSLPFLCHRPPQLEHPLPMPQSLPVDCLATQVHKPPLDPLGYLATQRNQQLPPHRLLSLARRLQQRLVVFLAEERNLGTALLPEVFSEPSQLLPLLLLLLLVACSAQSLRELLLLPHHKEAQPLLPLRHLCSVLSLQPQRLRQQAQHQLVASLAAAQQLPLHLEVPPLPQLEDCSVLSLRPPRHLLQLLLRLQLLAVFLAALLSLLLKHLRQSQLAVYSALLLAVKQQARQLLPLLPLAHQRPLLLQQRALLLPRPAVCSVRSQPQTPARIPARTRLSLRLPAPLPVP
jgi:hypothetical protein